MYHFFKQLIHTILPVRLIRRYKPALRSLVYPIYKGDKYACNICQAQLKSFLVLPNNDLLCPRCGSLPRTRRLYQILQKKQLINGHFLHFSPPYCLHKQLKQHTSIQYISSDYENEFIADVKYDLTNIPLGEKTVDIFIAYHVLEHIEADEMAMKELNRITKDNGYGLIQTPFKNGAIYEDNTVKTPAERLIHFGQSDHIRIYSVDGLKKRLEKSGFSVNVLCFKEKVNNYYGFKQEESVLLVTKLAIS